MATFHHIISRLDNHVIRYQLPYNQFSLPCKLLFLDAELSLPLEPCSFIFCDAETFSNAIRQELPPKICFFIAAREEELPSDIPYTCNYIVCDLSYPALCTRIVRI